MPADSLLVSRLANLLLEDSAARHTPRSSSATVLPSQTPFSPEPGVGNPLRPSPPVMRVPEPGRQCRFYAGDVVRLQESPARRAVKRGALVTRVCAAPPGRWRLISYPASQSTEISIAPVRRGVKRPTAWQPNYGSPLTAVSAGGRTFTTGRPPHHHCVRFSGLRMNGPDCLPGWLLCFSKASHAL